MDRVINFAGAIPLDTDLLNTNKYAMIGIAKLAHAILGDGPFLNSLSCVPTGPASLQVVVNPGQVYQFVNIDATAYGSIPADTGHSILKQGILLGAATLSCPAPATAGQSINYLIEVGYLDTDGGSTVLPYYNSANPAQAYNGPSNSGTSQNTVRQGVCSVVVKAGTAAATGTQATPAADAGYTGAYVVTVANGQTTILAGNIVAVSGAPFITDKLQAKITQAQADARYITQVFGDGRYAALAGLSSQLFSVANGTSPANAVNLGQFVTLLAANGYVKLPGGIIIQAGQVTTTTAGASTVTLPVAFPTACIAVVGTALTGTVGVTAQLASVPSTTSFSIASQNAGNIAGTVYWVAIGY